MNWLIIYNKETLQIERYISNSFKMPTLKHFGQEPERLACAELTDPEFEITRDKKVVLEDGRIVGTIDSLNPIQPPIPSPKRDLATELDSLKIRIEELEKR